jgi:hypothetical protein
MSASHAGTVSRIGIAAAIVAAESGPVRKAAVRGAAF